MILTLKQFLEQTDIGQETWNLVPWCPSNLKCQNRKIKGYFWQDYKYLYECCVEHIILSTHEIWLAKEHVQCRICENDNIDKEITINLIKQIGAINGNNLVATSFFELRNMARWDDIILNNSTYAYNSILHQNYNFNVQSWYIVDNILFVNEVSTSSEACTLKNVLLRVYIKDKQIYNGFVVKMGDWSAYYPWKKMGKATYLYNKKVIGLKRQAYRGMVEVTIEDDDGSNDNMNNTIDISINEDDVKKLKDAVESMKDVVSKIPDSQYTISNTDIKFDKLDKTNKSIIKLMCSKDYKDRFKAEYLQLKTRYNKLHNMVIKYEAGKLDFKPSCDIELLKKQKAAMGQYLYCLEVRAEVEGIDLDE